MKRGNQRSILMMLENAITVTCNRGGNKHAIRAHLEELDGNYVLRVQARLILGDGIFSRDITPEQVMKWSTNNMGDFFRGFLDWFFDEKKAAEKEAAKKKKAD